MAVRKLPGCPRACCLCGLSTGKVVLMTANNQLRQEIEQLRCQPTERIFTAPAVIVKKNDCDLVYTKGDLVMHVQSKTFYCIINVLQVSGSFFIDYEHLHSSVGEISVKVASWGERSCRILEGIGYPAVL